MTNFDASMAYYDEGSPSYTRSYTSYMCPSRNSYILPDGGSNLMANKFHYPWTNKLQLTENVSQKQFLDGKPPHISQLRNILSETISNITKNGDLKSDESVELTLEVELMKSLATPTNSLVEVTIIQNKPDEKSMIGTKLENVFEYKNKFRVDRNSSSSDCPSQKRRNWFERLVKKYYNKCPSKHSLEDVNTKNIRTQLPQITNNAIINSHKHDFVKVLCQDYTNNNIDYSNHRVSRTKKKVEDSRLGDQNKSLVKKLSKMFLQTNKVSTNNAIKSALSDLRKEVGHMKSLAEREKRNNDKMKTPVPKLGKLVSNIVNDVLENCDKPLSHEKASVQINYQSFYEPIVRNKPKKRSKHKLGENPFRKSSGFSLSDTCLAASKFGPVVKSSSSMNDCSQRKRFVRKKMTQCEEVGDSKLTYSMNKSKHVNPESVHCWNSKEKGDGKKNRFKKHKKRKKMNNKYSEIEWNGHTYEVNKEVKLRIEQIILNEIQNLALKEGMECDVSPLPSTDNSDNSFKSKEKISSFICEVDISDKQFQKVKSHKSKSLKRNASYVIEKKRSGKNLKRNHPKRVSRARNVRTDQISSHENDLKLTTTQPSELNSDSEICNEIKDDKDKLMNSKKQNITEDGFEIKYINNNTNKWSEESVTDDSVVEATNELTNLINQQESQDNLNGLTFKHLSSGFVKRIESNDSNWNDFPGGNDLVASNRCSAKPLKFTTQFVEAGSTRKTMISATSNESENHVQIELDLEGLETILDEAKKKQDCGKVVLNAKCKRGIKNKTRSREFTGKNSTSYTDDLLMKAAQKLEKYRRTKMG